MNIECDKSKKIFRNEKDGKVSYSIGLNRKNQDGTYTRGYITCRFPKDANIPNKTELYIVNAWLDFWVDDKKITHPYIFINKYTLKEDVQVPSNIKSEYDSLDSDVKLEDSDLPFI